MVNPWGFEAPLYDDRNKQNAGFVHGVGFTQPVGSEKVSMKGKVPMGIKNIDLGAKRIPEEGMKRKEGW